MELAHVTRVTTLGEMTASIAHEVNQPLTAVIANANASLRWLAAATQPRGSANAVSRLSAMVIGGRGDRRIRALVQKTDTEKVRLDINQTIQEVVVLMQNEAVRKGVAIRMDLATDVPPVFGDRIQLQQVILNLVMNGIEAMDTVADRPREMVIRSSATNPTNCSSPCKTPVLGSIHRISKDLRYFLHHQAAGNGYGTGDQPLDR